MILVIYYFLLLHTKFQIMVYFLVHYVYYFIMITF